MKTGSVNLMTMVLGATLVACGGGDDGGSGGGDGDGGGGPDAASASIDAAGNGPDAPGTDRFSFFVTSLATMRSQSGSQNGFGGNLGGLAGADMICQRAAAAVGYGHKTWRAFLSVYNNGQPIHAIDRVGNGPWYDRNGRLIAMNKAGLISGNRPAGDAATINDLPDENGAPLTTFGDTHDILTGSNEQGRLDPDPSIPGNTASANNTCQDWTSAATGPTLAPTRLGHSWPAQSGQHWIRAHTVRGCAPGVNLIQNGPGTEYTVGAGGGWGGIYCFALEP